MLFVELAPRSILSPNLLGSLMRGGAPLLLIALPGTLIERPDRPRPARPGGRPISRLGLITGASDEELSLSVLRKSESDSVEERVEVQWKSSYAMHDIPRVIEPRFLRPGSCAA